ncbi:MAG: hypothetical protein RR137_07035 [Odoribacter sp.]
MKIKEIKNLTSSELDGYKKSTLYEQVLNNYKLCDEHYAYYLEYFGKNWIDTSFVIFDENNYYICMYMLSNGNEFSFFGAPIDIYTIEADFKIIIRAYQELFAKLEEYKDIYGVSRIRIYDNPYFLSKYIALGMDVPEIEYYSNIDLLHSEEEIKMSVRKSYKSLINWGYRNIKIKLFDYSNITEEIIELFEAFHMQVSKRRTRSHKSWILQYEAVKKGMGYVLFGYLENELVASVLVLTSQFEAYYGVAVNNRDLMAENKPIGHALLLEAIFEAKRNGLKNFCLGNVTYSKDEKLNAIAKYKRGFSPLIDTKISYYINL